jgi:hypothetical protein
MSFYGSDCPAKMANANDWWKDGSKPMRVTLGNPPRTWKDDRADELKRRSYGLFYKLIFPPPIPIVSFPPLAKNEWLGWRGLD